MRHNPSSRRSWLPPAQRIEEPHGFSTLPSCHLFLHPIALVGRGQPHAKVAKPAKLIRSSPAEPGPTRSNALIFKTPHVRLPPTRQLPRDCASDPFGRDTT